MRGLAIAAVLAAWPLAAGAQGTEALEPGSGPFGDPMTCGRFEAMDSLGRARTLETIQPLGGEIDPTDPAESAGWSAAVSGKCQGTPDKLLEDAAREALQTP